MTSVLIISGSPSSTSRTERLARSIAERIAARDVSASLLDVRDLPAEDLLHARFDAPNARAPPVELVRAVDVGGHRIGGVGPGVLALIADARLLFEVELLHGTGES